jgi:hypothetical protein
LLWAAERLNLQLLAGVRFAGKWRNSHLDADDYDFLLALHAGGGDG